MPSTLTSLASPFPVPPVIVHAKQRRLSVAEYHRMIREGILGADAAVELLEGWLVQKMSRNPPHDVVIALLLKVLGALLPVAWHPDHLVAHERLIAAANRQELVEIGS